MKLFIDFKNVTILLLLMGIVITSPSSFANETEESESSSAAAYEVAPPSLEMDSTESTDFEEADDNEE